MLLAEGEDSGLAQRWGASDVATYAGTLAEIAFRLPRFFRTPFSIAGSKQNDRTINKYLDMIVREPNGWNGAPVPVGVVSREYSLVQHTDIVAAIQQALTVAGIAEDEITAKLSLTEYGERMDLSVYLPDRYSFDPGDGNPIGMRLEVRNSVDGSTRFRVLMGWFRFICGNGLILHGQPQASIAFLEIDDIADFRARHAAANPATPNPGASFKPGWKYPPAGMNET